jgi:hypothetical protein
LSIYAWGNIYPATCLSFFITFICSNRFDGVGAWCGVEMKHGKGSGGVSFSISHISLNAFQVAIGDDGSIHSGGDIFSYILYIDEKSESFFSFSERSLVGGIISDSDDDIVVIVYDTYGIFFAVAISVIITDISFSISIEV